MANPKDEMYTPSVGAVSNVPTLKNSVLVRMGARFGVEPNKLYATLKETAFKGDVSNEQFLALMIVADQYNLNPLTKEIYAFPDKNNGIVPVVGVDGWSRILNEHPQFDGIEFLDGPLDKNGLPAWIECKIFRKDRTHPTIVREYMIECRRGTGPWGSHPRRLLRHKSLIQCARIAMSFVGLYDQDEAERIIEGDVTVVRSEAIDELNAEVQPKAVPSKTEALEKLVAGTPIPQPLDLTGGPNLADVISGLRAAKTPDEVSAAEDLARSMPLNTAEALEVSVEIGAAMKRIATKS